MCHN